jgi:hypothetical protein
MRRSRQRSFFPSCALKLFLLSVDRSTVLLQFRVYGMDGAAGMSGWMLCSQPPACGS